MACLDNLKAGRFLRAFFVCGCSSEIYKNLKPNYCYYNLTSPQIDKKSGAFIKLIEYRYRKTQALRIAETMARLNGTGRLNVFHHRYYSFAPGQIQ